MQRAACWDNVVDFRWHRNTPSPHWSVIPRPERISELASNLLDGGWSVVVQAEEEIIEKLGEISNIGEEEEVRADVQSNVVEEEEEL